MPVSPAFLAQMAAALPPSVPQPPPPGPMPTEEMPAYVPPVVDIGDIDMPPAFPKPPAPAPPPGQPSPPAPSAPAPPPAISRPAEAPPDMPPDVQYRMVSRGGATPAGEAHIRGPKQEGLLLSSFQPPIDALDRAQLRSSIATQHAEDVYAQEAELAIHRQEQLEAAAQKRSQELAQMRTDYNNSIQQLGTMQLDHNRYWANKSVPEGIATVALLFIGGPKAEAAIDKRIQGDVEDQKFAYQNQLNIAKSKETAYAMAMQQYGQEDAAQAAATAAAQYATGMKLKGLEANWRGTDTANQLDMLASQYLQKASETAAAGFKFLPPQQAAAKYAVAIRGNVLPEPVTGKEANALVVEHGAKPAERVDEEMVKGGIQASLATQKAAAERGKEEKGLAIQMPNGETVTAPDKAEAEKLRDAVIGNKRLQRLVKQAEEIRKSDTWRASPEKRAQLGQIQKEMITQFSVQNKLGALSTSDLDLALGGTADLFNVGPGVEARLSRMANEGVRALGDRVSTYPGAPPKSAGVMPGSFQPVKK